MLREWGGGVFGGVGVYVMKFFDWSDFTATINGSCTQLDREVRGKISKCQILEM